MFRCLLMFVLGIRELMQRSRKVKYWYIDPKLSKGFMNVLTENTYTETNNFWLLTNPYEPWRTIMTLRTLPTKRFASGCLVSLVSIGPIRTQKLYFRTSDYSLSASTSNIISTNKKDYETYYRGEEKQSYYKSIWDLFQSSCKSLI